MKTVPETRPMPVQSPANYPKRLSRSVFDTILTTAVVTSVLFSGLFAGFLTAVLILEVSLRRFPASVYTQVRLVELDHLDDLATILLPAALLSTATLVTMTMSRRERVRWPALIALGLLAATFTISLLISVSHQHCPTELVGARTAKRLGDRARPLADCSPDTHHHRSAGLHDPYRSHDHTAAVPMAI